MAFIYFELLADGRVKGTRLTGELTLTERRLVLTNPLSARIRNFPGFHQVGQLIETNDEAMARLTRTELDPPQGPTELGGIYKLVADKFRMDSVGADLWVLLEENVRWPVDDGLPVFPAAEFNELRDSSLDEQRQAYRRKLPT